MKLRAFTFSFSHFLNSELEGRDCLIFFSPLWLNLSQQRIALSLLVLLISHIPLSDNFHPFLIYKEFSFQETFECYFKVKLIFHLYVIKLCGQKEIALELQT